MENFREGQTASIDKGASGEANYPRLLLFDLVADGHHPSYILYLAQHWCEHKCKGQLDIVVSPEFIRRHTHIINTVKEYQRSNIRFVVTEPEEELGKRKPGFSGAVHDFKEWQLFCKYARLCRSDHALLLYFDTAQLPFIFGQKPPCQVSGIYFRPTFHYSSFGHFSPNLKDRFQILRERFNLSQTIDRAYMGKLFCLDPFVSSYINQGVRDTAMTLADPVKIYSSEPEALSELRDRLKIQPGRDIFLMFGALTKRKGIDEVLDAIALLPLRLSKKLCLLTVGALGSGPEEKHRMLSRISALTESSGAQIIVRDEFVPDQEVQLYFQMSDFVLAPYQKHVGMSHILIRAAVAQKPVISSDYGLMGELTRRFNLGLTVDSTSSTEIAAALGRYIEEQDRSRLGDNRLMKQFGSQNLATTFTSTVFHHLLNLAT